MSLDVLIMLAGVLVAAMPFLGFPTSWNTVIFFVLGVFVFALGVVVRRRGKRDTSSPTDISGTADIAPQSDIPRPLDDDQV
ncbi:MAG: hypothetical protein U1D26_00300 [Patescibacteria group bacterium]|nr:hypothetical protein [bacterium]MDZ4226900.1 hypothetical protein [Patescibacteria group bacterium]